LESPWVIPLVLISKRLFKCKSLWILSHYF
jgi:hypothetical protein